jgi:2-isopropylmalate synthase
MAMVELRRGKDDLIADTALGDGPVHAACMAIERLVGVQGRLEQFQIRAASPGKDALGEAHVIVDFDDRPFTGTGVSTDIIEAAVRAYLNALNKYLAVRAS